MFLFSPLEQFEVVSLITLTIPVVGSFVLSLTNLGFYAILSVILILGLHILGNNLTTLIPNRWSIGLESVYLTIYGIVRDQIGSKHEIYTPFVFGLFWFLLISNLNGNIPYGFTITTSAMTAINLSFLIFLGVTILAIVQHGMKFFSFFVPGGTPLILVPILVIIELISYLARAVSLGVRLFSNIVAGHTLLKILSTFLSQLFGVNLITGLLTLIPFTIFVGLIGLEIAVSIIQSYVFCVLTCSYIKDAILLH